MKRTLFKSFFKRYLPFTRGVMQESLTYRFRFVFWLLFQFLYLIIAYYLWKGVFSAHAVSQSIDMVDVRIGEYTFATMVLYVFFERIVSGLTQLPASNYIEDDISDGNIAMRLIKPLDYRKQLFFQSLGFAVVNMLVFALPFTIALVIYGVSTDLSFSPDGISIVLFIFSIFFGAIINYLISFAFGMIIFFTLNSFGMWQLREAIELVFTGGLIPIALFPTWLRGISAFLPFAQTKYVPITFIMGLYEGDLIGGLLALGTQVLWIMALYFLTTFAWRKATRRVVVQGG